MAATLDAFKEEIKNLKFRRGVVIFGPAATTARAGESITGVDTANSVFTVGGDATADYVKGLVAQVDGSTGNDGFYHVVDAVYDSTNAVTNITVEEAIPDATADGLIYAGYKNYRNLNVAGIIRDTNTQLEAVEFGPDNQNRTFVKAFDLMLQWVLMQTGATELQNLPALANPSGNGLYITITNGPVPAPLDSAAGYQTHDLHDEKKIEFVNASVSPSIDLNFSREESGITNEVTGTIEVADLEKLYVEPILLA